MKRSVMQWHAGANVFVVGSYIFSAPDKAERIHELKTFLGGSMIADLEGLYSHNAKNLKKSVIRELLKLTNETGDYFFCRRITCTGNLSGQ
ncbi:MAG: hypothetical protein MZV65_45030 [Chromatiales bacterium]|nr:hypothetical protein [Chromatiales bacterium]